MLSDVEVLTLGRSCSRRIPGSGAAWGLSVEARMLSKELESSANGGGSKSQRAYDVCRKALRLYWRESGFGRLLYIVNSRLRKVVMALLKEGACAKAALPNSSTALSLAKSKGHMEIVALLEKA
jgi:hypothetical protein